VAHASGACGARSAARESRAARFEQCNVILVPVRAARVEGRRLGGCLILRVDTMCLDVTVFATADVAVLDPDELECGHE